MNFANAASKGAAQGAQGLMKSKNSKPEEPPIA